MMLDIYETLVSHQVLEKIDVYPKNVEEFAQLF